MSKRNKPNWLVAVAWKESKTSGITIIGIRTVANGSKQATINAINECSKLGLTRFTLTYQAFEI
jgi:hypothetical protein